MHPYFLKDVLLKETQPAACIKYVVPANLQYLIADTVKDDPI